MRVSSCCGPDRSSAPGAESGAPALVGAASATRELREPSRDRPQRVSRNMVKVPGGTYTLGSDTADASVEDGEGPVREVTVREFLIDRCAVTNRQYSAFVRATGYESEAETIGWSYVFHLLLSDAAHPFVMNAVVPAAPWWLAVRGATWRTPHGPGSTPLPNHPVVHVSWNDAAAYAQWAGKRLPTESEWETAARGGLHQATYPWGDELTPCGRHRCNVWQGSFPDTNSEDDGFVGTAPVDAYRPNAYGLYNMVGNVWEWCSDWWSTDWHAETSDETRVDPTGPLTGQSRVVRGGSYLCHDSYCNRYRVAARTHNTSDSSTGNMGFRCALG